jgi:hypothetical protein
VRITDFRRSILRDGQGRLGITVGPVLAAAPVLIPLGDAHNAADFAQLLFGRTFACVIKQCA